MVSGKESGRGCREDVQGRARGEIIKKFFFRYIIIIIISGSSGTNPQMFYDYFGGFGPAALGLN